MCRTIRSACASSSARWSVTPEVREWTSPPPSSSAVTTSPVAAFTSGGPPRKIVPWFADDHGLVAHRRDVRAARRAGAQHRRDLRDARAGHPGLVVEDPAEVVPVGEDLVLHRQEGAARVDQVDAGQPVLQRDLLGAQVLLHRHRVVRAALDRGVVGDDDHSRPRDPADAGDHARRPAPRPRTSPPPPAAPAPGRASPGRAGRPPGPGAAACRAPRAGRGPSRRRRAGPWRAASRSSSASSRVRRLVGLPGLGRRDRRRSPATGACCILSSPLARTAVSRIRLMSVNASSG